MGAAAGGGELVRDEGASQRAGGPGPRLWCAGFCGNWVDNIGEEGDWGAVLVRLGQEAFWFCGAACARKFLDQMCDAAYEGWGSLDCMLWNTISEN